MKIKSAKIFLLIPILFFFIFSSVHAALPSLVGFASDLGAEVPSIGEAADTFIPDLCDANVIAIPGAFGALVLGSGPLLVSDNGVKTELAKANCYVKKIKNQDKRQNFWEQIFNEYLLPLLSTIGKQIARDLIIDFTDATVNWINGGYNGQPAYVTDLNQFITRSADLSAGDFIYNNPDLNFLCSTPNFQANVKLALNLAYAPTTAQFRSRIGCTLSDATQNFLGDLSLVENQIKNNDLNQWYGWLQVTANPQNDEVGAFFIAQEELDSNIANSKGAAEAKLGWGSGALSYSECTSVLKRNVWDDDTGTYSVETISGGEKPAFGIAEYYSDVDVPPDTDSSHYFRELQNCVDKTPGAAVTEMLGFKATSEGRVDELQAALSDGIDQVLGAVINQLWKQLAQNLEKGLLNPQGDKAAYERDRDNGYQTLQSNFNNKLNNMLQNYYNPVTDCSPKTYGSGSSSYIFYPCPDGATTSSSTPEIDHHNDALFSQKSDAVAGIQLNYIAKEGEYKAILENISQMLVNARKVFDDARICNATETANGLPQGDPEAVWRKDKINPDVLLNIDGANSYPGRDVWVQTITDWNLDVNTRRINEALANIHTLETKINEIWDHATTTEGIDVIVSSIAAVTWHDPNDIATYTDNAKIWLQTMDYTFSVDTSEYPDYCPIDIEEILNPSI